MGKQRLSWRHALPVQSPYAVNTNAAVAVAEPLILGRDVRVRNLTAPSATETALPKQLKKKNKKKKDVPPPPVKKVGLGVLADTRQGPEGGGETRPQAMEVEGGSAGGITLKESIVAVLKNRPVAKSAKEREKEMKELDSRVEAQKEAAVELKKLLKENEEQEQDRMDLTPVSDDDDSDNDDNELVISSRFNGALAPPTQPLKPSNNTNGIASISSNPSNSPNPSTSSNSSGGEVKIQPTQPLPPSPSTPTGVQGQAVEIKWEGSNDMAALQPMDYMDLDALEELFSDDFDSTSPPQDATGTPSTPSKSNSGREEVVSPPFLTRAQLPLRPSLPISPSTSTSSSAAAASLLPPPTGGTSSNATSPSPLPPLLSALPLIQNRARKPKKTIPVAFDYQSAEEEDSEPLPAARSSKAEGRPRHGRALEGDDLSYLPGATQKAFAADPDLLPASKAHAKKLVPKNYQTALLERAKQENIVTY